MNKLLVIGQYNKVSNDMRSDGWDGTPRPYCFIRHFSRNMKGSYYASSPKDLIKRLLNEKIYFIPAYIRFIYE